MHAPIPDAALYRGYGFPPEIISHAVWQRFTSSEQAQRFLEPFSTVCNHFRPRRHRLTATAYRQLMEEQRQTWREVTAVSSAR